MNSTEKVTKLISDINDIKSNIPEDRALRKTLYESLRELSFALEAPLDTIARIGSGASCIAIVQTAIDLNLFEILTKNASPMSVNQLAKETKTDPILLERILRYLAAFGCIGNSSPNQYHPTTITQTLARPNYAAGIKWQFEFLNPCYLHLPTYLAQTNYANPSNHLQTAAQIAHKTSLPVFAWASTQPSINSNFNLFMTAVQQDAKSWLDVFPLDRFLKDGGKEEPVFVDIGGGVGHQCLALKKRCPGIKREVVCQDLKQAVEQAVGCEGVRMMEFDFFEKQPIRGASFYFLRHVLHDHTDEKCIKILRNTMNAMEANSVLLVDEMVLPDKGVNWQAVDLDVSLMATLAAMERSEREWGRLWEGVGLRVVGKWVYEEGTGSCVVGLVKGDS